jgi:beta-galactosidase GanA
VYIHRQEEAFPWGTFIWHIFKYSDERKPYFLTECSRFARLQLWKDRLLRVKALGLNTIQTYVPWNLLNFNGSADLVSFLQMAQDLDLMVMLRIGPYICGGMQTLNFYFTYALLLDLFFR